MATKDPITCHVLDTLTGRPAAGLMVHLSCITFSGLPFGMKTNSDGRIENWGVQPINEIAKPVTVEKILNLELDPHHDTTTTVWKLRFFTGDYYGEGKTFWPEVELMFYVKPGEHYHVPLLLGPFSYTTYRGS